MVDAKELVRRYEAGERDFVQADLSRASLTGAGLSGANLTGAKLNGAALLEANLLTADLTDDLELARREIGWLAETFERDERFAQPDIMVGPEDCDRIGLLNRLSCGEYGLVHYSGHTQYDGEKGSWQLNDGDITTGMLTNALQMAPPALVFSSASESAKASPTTTFEYGSQSFDLPSAFLQAGVEAYVGTLRKVSETPAQQFVEEFYDAFLTAEYDLGECLRRAKWACKQRAAWNERINYLAYVLYGDPHVRPSDLFPALGQ